MRTAKKASLMQMVGEECANLTAGACRGMELDGKLAGALPFCLLAKRLPCAYAERCLLPMAGRRSEYARVAVEYMRRTANNIKRARQSFQGQLFPCGMRNAECGAGGKAAPDLAELLRAHPFCRHTRACPDCGDALAIRQRVCGGGCKEKRRKAATKAAGRRHRQKVKAAVGT